MLKRSAEPVSNCLYRRKYHACLMPVCMHWVISHIAHSCAPPLDFTQAHSLTVNAAQQCPVNLHREYPRALTCVALSAVKEEPHRPQGQFSSEEPFGYSSGRHRPASSASACTAVGRSVPPFHAAASAALLPRHLLWLRISLHWAESWTDMCHWCSMAQMFSM